MKLIIGLGNPGEKYKNTRHNVGFMFLDVLKEKLNFPEFKESKKFQAEISESKASEEKFILAKPLTFMNKSGHAASSIMNFYKIKPSDLILIHDDLDLEIGSYKISSSSRAAGHNGVQNIFDHLGTQEIKRVRIGVEKIGGRANRIESGHEYVLKDFTKEEREIINSIFPDIIQSTIE